MAMPLDRPGSLMTLAEFVSIAADGHRYELQEGVLVMSPKPVRRHQIAMARLFGQLERQLPEQWEVVPDFEVIVRAAHPATVRAPDLAVVRRGGAQARVPAADVLLAVEIMSPGTRNVDRWMKRSEYAAAGIPFFWLLDLDQPGGAQLTAFELQGDEYSGAQLAVGTLRTAAPFPLVLDLARLVNET